MPAGRRRRGLVAAAGGLLIAAAAWIGLPGPVPRPAAAHERLKGVIGFIGRKGDRVFSSREIHEAGSFAGGLAFARIHRGDRLLYGFIGRDGKFAIEARFESASTFSEGLAFVREAGGRSGWIDPTGRWAVEVPAEEGGPFRGGLACAALDGKWGYLGRDGGEAVPLRFERAFDFSEGLGRVRSAGRLAFVDPRGATVLGPLAEVSECHDFRGGLARARVKNRWGFLDRAGKWAIPARYQAAYDLTEGLAAVQSGEEWLYLDARGKEQFRIRCEWALGFSDGLALLLSGEKMGFLDRSGKVAVPPRFFKAFEFSEGLARVEELDGM